MKLKLMCGVGIILMSTAQATLAQDLTQSLYSADLDHALRYGSAMALDGNTLVVADMGVKTGVTPTSCGQIDGGAVYIYTRSSPTAPWPAQPTQSLLGSGAENHFGNQVFLKGNRLIIGEPRADVPPNLNSDGAFYYYARPNASAPFTLVDTEFRPSDAEGPFFTEPGLASNGQYVVAVAQGNEPNVYVYELTATAAVPRYSFSLSPSLYFGAQIGLTDNNILVTVLPGQTQAHLYQLGATSATELGSSQLALSNGTNETDNQYLGNLSVEGNRVAIAARRTSTAPATNGVKSYYLKTFELGGAGVANVERINLPQTYTSATGYVLPGSAVEVAPGPHVFVNVAGEQTSSGNTMVTLGYRRLTGGGYDLVSEINLADFSPDAGLGVHQNYGRPVIFDGKNLYVGDSHDETVSLSSGVQCDSLPEGVVQIFENAVPGNPTTVCSGAQDVVFSLDPIPGAVSYSWWSPGATSVVSNGSSAVVDFGAWFTTTTVNMDVTLNVPPYFVRKTLNVSAKNCAAAPPPLQGPTTACAGERGVVYSLGSIPNATSYNWWSPGTTNIFSYGPGAIVDFGTWSSSTTINVQVGLSVPPYSQNYSLNVGLNTCN